jgi:predicted esterase
LDWQINHEKIKPENIILGGFSQGAAMSLFTGLTCDVKLGGILSMSGYLPIQMKTEQLFTTKNVETPILMCHGDSDMVVPFEFGQWSHEFISSKRPKNLQFLKYKKMGHTANAEELQDISIWMKTILNKN